MRTFREFIEGKTPFDPEHDDPADRVYADKKWQQHYNTPRTPFDDVDDADEAEFLAAKEKRPYKYRFSLGSSYKPRLSKIPSTAFTPKVKKRRKLSLATT